MRIEGLNFENNCFKSKELGEFKQFLDKLEKGKTYKTSDGYRNLDRIEIYKDKDGYYAIKLVTFEASQNDILQLQLEKAKKIVQEALEGKDDDEKQEYAILYPRYQDFKDEHQFNQGDLVNQYGILYRCKKAHKKDYQALPQLLGEYWELVKNKPDKPKNPNLPKDKPPFYESDKTYKIGDYVLFGDKVYRRINKSGNDGSPFSDPKNWELIGKWEE